MEAGNSRPEVATLHCRQLEVAGIGRSVGVADMPLLGAVADSRLRVAVGWHMAPAHSRWPLLEASEPQYMTLVISGPN